MNYGHSLRFGTFITPHAAAPTTVVDLARRSEELGFDVVTVQDHPYRPDRLDTWTLLSWIAGVTSRIHLAGNVLNLPLRPPAVLARASASLDLLSRGRAELALGAGAYWDAIAAMGGPRHSPGSAVDALSEAIDVIRHVVGGEQNVSYDGRFYKLSDVQPGPPTPHDIPIWLGAGKPRMLRLLGTKADGWLVTAGGLQSGGLNAGNKIIDEAALAAGRDPSDVRRLLNIAGRFSARSDGFLTGPSRQWIDDLLPLVVDDGISTFVLMTDDAGTMERFTHEVIPGLRAAVERELALPTAEPRSAAVRRLRRPGIDYDHVPASVADAVVEPGDGAYSRVRSTYLRGGAPGLVMQPRNTAEVVDALVFARNHPETPLGVRSGGHGVSGRSTNDGGIVIDLSRLDHFEVIDIANRRVRIGPGLRWKEVAAALAPYGWALSSGDYGGVGVGGLATTAGIGYLVRKHGLTIDHLVGVEIVLATGEVVQANAVENPDLFWAVRGAGANFGIVTSFEFQVDEVADVGYAQLALASDDAADLVMRFGQAATNAPRDTTAFVLLGPISRGQPATAQVRAMVDSDDPDTIIEQLDPFARIGRLFDQQVVITPYASVMANVSEMDHHGQGEPVARSGFFPEMTSDVAEAIAELLRSRVVYFFQLRTVGAAVNDIDPDATAFAHRSSGFQITALGISQQRMDQVWDPFRRRHLDGLYLSFESDLRPERLTDAFPPATLDRLRKLKAKYDPDNVFRDNFNITPASKDVS